MILLAAGVMNCSVHLLHAKVAGPVQYIVTALATNAAGAVFSHTARIPVNFV